MMATALTYLAGALLVAQLPAGTRQAPAGQAVPPGGLARLSYCVVSPVEEVQLSAQEAGILKAFDVREGAPVDEGMVVARIDDADSLVRKTAADLELMVARTEAENDIDVRAAKAAAKVAAAEVAESEWVNRKSPGSIPETQVRRQRFTQERSELQIGVAEMEFKVAGMTADLKQAQVDIADLQLERRTIKSPLAGRVEQRFRQVGEWVNPGDPILRIVRMDRLRVEGFLKASEFAPDEVNGQPVEVEVTLERGRTERFRGKIEFVSLQVEASGEFRVWAEVENRRTEGGLWLLRPGLPAQMDIQLK
ncbi:MAG: HlyD family efflux transporter periplasmic adaptor subunit [Pirellulaceae bacterium]|nr:HlyD family efflux transporter periplasmic adaptor subunit [Pirellulaceae bacterium]